MWLIMAFVSGFVFLWVAVGVIGLCLTVLHWFGCTVYWVRKRLGRGA